MPSRQHAQWRRETRRLAAETIRSHPIMPHTLDLAGDIVDDLGMDAAVCLLAVSWQELNFLSRRIPDREYAWRLRGIAVQIDKLVQFLTALPTKNNPCTKMFHLHAYGNVENLLEHHRNKDPDRFTSYLGRYDHMKNGCE